MKYTLFKEITIEKPVDKIISQVRELISSGQLQPGDKLPPERKLAERFGVGRTHVREALQKLEFYGILKTLPQSGTVVAGLGIKALEGLISNVLRIEHKDFHSLVESRVILETNASMLAAGRRTNQDLAAIEAALEAYSLKVMAGESAVEEDIMFHLAIAEASKNFVLKSLIMIVLPDILSYFIKSKFCQDGRYHKALDEHRLILDCIRQNKVREVEAVMKEHLKEILQHSISEKGEMNSFLLS